MKYREIERVQKKLCEKLKLPWVASPHDFRVGVSKNIKEGLMPINGLRHPPEQDTAGWYLWAGEDFSTDLDFWDVQHISHLDEMCPLALKYLGLPPGWRFITDGTYEDIWEDVTLRNPNLCT
jgi:hypothetical protein